VLCFTVILLVSGHGGMPIATANAAIGGPFRLIDQNGKAITDQELKGKPFLVSSASRIVPRCVRRRCSTCREIFNKLGPDADKINALFITVDPERDTPAALKDYLSSFDPHLIGVGGDADALAAVAKEYRRLLQESPAQGRRLHDGPHGDRLSDGQERPVRRAVQPQAEAGRVCRRLAPLF